MLACVKHDMLSCFFVVDLKYHHRSMFSIEVMNLCTTYKLESSQFPYNLHETVNASDFYQMFTNLKEIKPA